MSRKKILIFPFDLLSHYLRCIVLADNYKDYEILFASSHKYNQYVIKEGYSVFNVAGFNSEKVMRKAERFNFSWLNYKDIETVFLSQVKAIQDLRPDIVLGDTSPTLKCAAEYTGVNYISLMNGYMSRYYSGVRNVSRKHYSYPIINLLPVKAGGFITRFAERIAFKSIQKPFRQLRKKYNLKKVSGYLSELEGDENLICDEPTLFPQHELPSNYKFTGPLLYTSGKNEKELLDRIDPKKQTICVCLGSSGNWKELEFLSDPYYASYNIITGGDLKRVLHGSHILSRDFVNLDEVLPTCSLLICHGGNGTIYHGIKHKVFMLFITSHFEQEWNAQRLEKLNLGISIHGSTQKKLNRILKDNFPPKQNQILEKQD